MLPEVDYKKLGNQIKKIRKEKKLTQEKLAELVGCNTSHISNIENNYTKLSLNVLLAIANALDVSVDYLLSNQINNSDSAVTREIVKRLGNCSSEEKEKILKIIDIISD